MTDDAEAAFEVGAEGWAMLDDFPDEMVREASEFGLYESTDMPMPPREQDVSLGVSYRVVRIARFLHINYPSDCCRAAWEEIDQDCRDGWLAEAAVIYGLATGERG